MATEIKLPELGEGTESGDVVRVMVAVGDVIDASQPVIELESDKASLEVPSGAAGKVVSVLVSVGDTVSVGQPILRIDADAASGQETEGAEAQPSPTAAAAGSAPAESAAHPEGSSTSAPTASGGRHEMKLPNLGEGAEEGDVVSLLVAVGDAIQSGQSIIEVESDKASVEIPADASGTVLEIAVSPGDTVTAGQTVLILDPGSVSDARANEATPEPSASEPPPPERSAQPESVASAPEPSSADGPLFASPSVRGFARERGVDLHQVPGSGPAGRISKEDVEAFIAEGSRPSAATPAAATRGSEAVAKAVEPSTGDRREKMPAIRRTIADRMTVAWQTIPHVTLYREADATELEAVRQRFKARAQDRGAKLTVTALLVKICASVLKRFPAANASVDMTSHEVVHHDDIHIGVAADTDRGLVVPVLREVERRGVYDIASALQDLAAKARDGKLSRAEMQGATFSVSNLGGLGIGFFTPIINPPEVAILGVGRAKKDAEQRLQMPLSLSIDHRMLDGADGARFLDAIVEAIEDPMSMIMEG